MRVATTLPATLRGEFAPPTPTPPGVRPFQHMEMPTMPWYLDPLPEGAPSEVHIVIHTEESERAARGSDDWRARLEERQQRLIVLRPEAVGWISTVETHGVVDVFQGAPLAPLVYEWLNKDLAAIKWQ